MDDIYFVLYCSDSGDHYLTRHTKADLERALAEHDWGEGIPIREWSGKFHQINLAEQHGLYIFKGPCVVPQAKTVVTEWVV